MLASEYIKIIEQAGLSWRKQEENAATSSGIWIQSSTNEKTFYDTTSIRHATPEIVQLHIDRLAGRSEFESDWQKLPLEGKQE